MRLGATNLTKIYSGRTILDIPEIELAPGGVTLILGANGAGKTTLARLLGLIDEPTGGRVTIDGAPAPRFGGRRLRARRRMSILFAEPYFFRGSVLENTAYGLRVRGVSRAEREKRARAALHQVGLADFAGRSAAELSSGEAQRAALARALVVEPEVLFLDEPFSNLDRASVVLVRELIPRLANSGSTVVLITHDLEFAASLEARRLTLVDGRLTE